MTTEEVTKKAEDLAKIYNPDNLSPFPFERIQKEKKNLEIFLVDQSRLPNNVSGAISFDKVTGVFSIYINQQRPSVRQHFTLGHEVGHYFLHQDIIKRDEVLIDEDTLWGGQVMLYRKDAFEAQGVEKEANKFAATLIMPSAVVSEGWKRLRSIPELADIFQVSVSAMSIRMEELGLLQ